MRWQIQLQRDDGSDTASVALSGSGEFQLQVVKGSAGLALLHNDLNPIRSRPDQIGNIICKDGAAFVTSFTENTFIKPETSSKPHGLSRYPLPRSTYEHLHSFWLRPGDQMLFSDLKYILSADLVSGSLPNLGVEVKSSGAAPVNGDAKSEAANQSDEMDLDATIVHPAIESQVDGPPFSTAPSQFVVQETPTAVRTSRLPTESPIALKTGVDEASHPQLPVEDTLPEDPADFVLQNDEPQDDVVSPSKDPKDQQPVDADDDAIVLGIAKQTPKRTYASKKRGAKRSLAESDDVETPKTSDGRSSKRQRKSANAIETSPVQKEASPVAAPSPSGKSRRKSAKTSKSPKNGKTVDEKPPAVVFSQSSIESKKTVLKFLDANGVTVSQDVSVEGNISTVCCVGKGDLKTTAKVLMALALNCPVVTDDWIEESVAAKKLLDPQDYLVESLKSTRDIDHSQLFEGKSIIFTHAARKAYGPGFTSITSILKAAGADDVRIEAARAVEADSNTLVIGLDKGDNDALSLLQKDVDCYSKDLISASILHGQLLVDDPEMHLSVPADSKKTPSGKKGERKS